MANMLYSGTSAYKIDQYYDYANQVQKKQDERKEKSHKQHILNIKKISVAIAAIFALSISFLYANVVLIETSSQVTDLTRELEDMKVRNTQVSFDIVSDVDYGVVEQKAISEFGMQRPESYQNVYVDVVQNDYVEVAKSKARDVGFVEGLITNVQSFLAYIN